MCMFQAMYLQEVKYVMIPRRYFYPILYSPVRTPVLLHLLNYFSMAFFALKNLHMFFVFFLILYDFFLNLRIFHLLEHSIITSRYTYSFLFLTLWNIFFTDCQSLPLWVEHVQCLQKSSTTSDSHFLCLPFPGLRLEQYLLA